MTPSELGNDTSFDHIERHARATPDGIAVTGPDGRISWARFRSDAARFARALIELGVEPGQIAAISYPDRYIHWLLGIACEYVGAVFAPYAAIDPAEDTGPMLDLADIILAEQPSAGDKHRLLDEDWIAGVFAASEPPETAYRPLHPAAPDAPLRIVRTSGSTGTPKYMVLPRQMQTRAISLVNFRTTAPRYYAAYPLMVNPAHYRMEACLRLGGTVIFGQASQDLVTYQATHSWLLPRDMAKLLQGVTGRWPSPMPLHISLGGGPVSPALHDATASALETRVQIFYATNETGFVGMVDRDGVGTLLPGVGFQIRDEEGLPAPEGEPGRIAVRTPSMVTGYLNDPEATKAFFAQGWFLTDDEGILLPDGRFRVLGRRSEVMNLGGLKLRPASIEETLRASMAGIRDLAVTSVINPQGIDEICVAVVPDGSASQSALFEQVRAALPPALGKFWLLPVERLPIGASGKVQQETLREIFAAATAPVR